MTSDAGLTDALIELEQRVATATHAMRSFDPDPENAFRGLYITDEHVDRMLAGRAGDLADPVPAPTGRLATLAQRFDHGLG